MGEKLVDSYYIERLHTRIQELEEEEANIRTKCPSKCPVQELEEEVKAKKDGWCICIGENIRLRKALEFYANREKMGAIQHSIWSKWMSWMLENGGEMTQAGWLMDAKKHERWVRQMNTIFEGLSKEEQQSDIKVVNEFYICDVASEALKDSK